MAWWIPLAAGLGAGLLKSEAVDRPREKRQRRLAAETQRYSPWTGMTAQPVQEADPFGSAFQGGLTGLSLGQGMEMMKGQKELADAQMRYLDRLGPRYPEFDTVYMPNIESFGARKPSPYSLW